MAKQFIIDQKHPKTILWILHTCYTYGGMGCSSTNLYTRGLEGPSWNCLSCLNHMRLLKVIHLWFPRNTMFLEMVMDSILLYLCGANEHLPAQIWKTNPYFFCEPGDPKMIPCVKLGPFYIPWVALDPEGGGSAPRVWIAGGARRGGVDGLSICHGSDGLGATGASKLNFLCP